MSMEDDQHARLLAFQALLDASRDAREQVVEISTFRRLCGRGIPEQPRHLRPLAYSLLLQTLPPQKASWDTCIRAQRKRYHALVKQYMQELESMPSPSRPLATADKTLKTISTDIQNAIPRFPYLKSRTHTSESSPLSPPASADSETAKDVDSAEESGGSSEGSDDGGEVDETSARSVEGSGKKTERPSRQKRLLCRRAASRRLEMIAQAEYLLQRQQQATVPPKQGEQSQAWTSNHQEQQSSEGDDPSKHEDHHVEVDGAQSSESGPSKEQPVEPKSPPPLQTPSVALSPPADTSQSITLLSPRDIPPAGSPSAALFSGELLQDDTHAEALVRLLYIFSRVHPQLPVQGLIDMLAILYSVYLEIDLSSSIARGRKSLPPVISPTGLWAEEQTYFAFCALTQRFSSIISSRADGEEGIDSALQSLSAQLRWADTGFWYTLQTRGLDPASPLYAFRWLAMLFSQDLPPTDVLHIWDFVLAETFPAPDAAPTYEPLIDISVSIILRCKRLLMGYQPMSPAPRPGKGLWGDVDEYDEPEQDRETTQDLAVLRSPPIQQIGGIRGVLRTAFEMRTARLVSEMGNVEPSAEPKSPSSSWKTTIANFADSDQAASIAKASTNMSASVMSTWSTATKAVSLSRIPSISSRNLFNRHADDEVSDEVPSGETYTSLPSTPRQHRTGRNTFSPPRGDHIRLSSITHTPVRFISEEPDNRRESVTSNKSRDSAMSNTSLQDRLAALTSTITSPIKPEVSPTAAEAPTFVDASGIKPLVLGSRRVTPMGPRGARQRPESPAISIPASPSGQRSNLPLSAETAPSATADSVSVGSGRTSPHSSDHLVPPSVDEDLRFGAGEGATGLRRHRRTPSAGVLGHKDSASGGLYRINSRQKASPPPAQEALSAEGGRPEFQDPVDSDEEDDGR